ncbi:uncharacterized protein LOC128880735 isoform X1 [Hylaeus volcanicus]|uniref:uncharacterized protein LOC128880735 isoform X1 n=3 Tax=Hylaeus volcanicus TaxID=313075 RepID=UPI0023B7CF8B|nr:uncharacterized protein LOC128880735 isoform X1 [Hylaeus volcanicus]
MFIKKMARNAKKKLAIFVGTSKCLIYAEAKYCASEMPGEIKYYECSRTEYCCGIGCCVSPGLHFHHLWYYWILVIIMFLVCSGGGWWYRYWLQGRYRAAASAIPTRASNPRAQSSLRGPTCQVQRARITYDSARNTVLLHRMWKGPQRNGAVPAYNGNATTSTHYQNMSVVLNDANCPYYQLYGPPPSYETVIAQTRGKISNPASPESSNARTNAQSPSILPNSSVPQCFSYGCNPSTRLNGGLDQSTQYQNGNVSPRQLDNPEAGPFTRFPYCVADGPIRQNVCVPFDYQEQPFVPEDGFSRGYQGASTYYAPYSMDKSSDTSDPENQSFEAPRVDRYMMVNIDCTAGSSREQSLWETNDRSISKVHGKEEKNTSERVEESWGEHRRIATDSASGFFSIQETDGSCVNDSKSTVNSSDDFESEFSRSRRVYGGSLKATGKYAGNAKCEEYSVERAFSKTLPRSCEGLINTEPAKAITNASRDASPLEDTANASVSSFQSNPSSNVILESFVFDGASSSTENVENAEEERRSRLTNASTNSDLESNHRLDRSKSLD